MLSTIPPSATLATDSQEQFLTEKNKKNEPLLNYAKETKQHLSLRAIPNKFFNGISHCLSYAWNNPKKIILLYLVSYNTSASAFKITPPSSQIKMQERVNSKSQSNSDKTNSSLDILKTPTELEINSSMEIDLDSKSSISTRKKRSADRPISDSDKRAILIDLQKKAKTDDTAKMQLAEFYMNGNPYFGIKKNSKKAYGILSSIDTNKFPQVNLSLAKMIADGRGVEKNMGEAIKLLKNVMENEKAEGAFRSKAATILGELSQAGLINSEKQNPAITFFEKAIALDEDNSKAHMELAKILYWISPNAFAKPLYKAAKLGVEEAKMAVCTLVAAESASLTDEQWNCSILKQEVPKIFTNMMKELTRVARDEGARYYFNDGAYPNGWMSYYISRVARQCMGATSLATFTLRDSSDKRISMFFENIEKEICENPISLNPPTLPSSFKSDRNKLLKLYLTDLKRSCLSDAENNSKQGKKAYLNAAYFLLWKKDNLKNLHTEQVKYDQSDTFSSELHWVDYKKMKTASKLIEEQLRKSNPEDKESYIEKSDMESVIDVLKNQNPKPENILITLTNLLEQSLSENRKDGNILVIASKKISMSLLEAIEQENKNNSESEKEKNRNILFKLADLYLDSRFYQPQINDALNVLSHKSLKSDGEAEFKKANIFKTDTFGVKDNKANLHYLLSAQHLGHTAANKAITEYKNSVYHGMFKYIYSMYVKNLFARYRPDLGLSTAITKEIEGDYETALNLYEGVIDQKNSTKRDRLIAKEACARVMEKLHY